MTKLKIIILSISFLAYEAGAQKIKGVNFVAEKTHVDSGAFMDLKKINADWMSWSPYAFCNKKTGEVSFKHQWQWEGESLEGTAKAIKLAKEAGLKIMIKPHVWMSDNSYTGTMQLNDSAWAKWKYGYKWYILNFAQLAQEQQVDLFCIGTEQYSSIKQDPDYWEDLIGSIKRIYKGKLTYAGNWDSYRYCFFWDQLDYIGVDAYFPLSLKANPSIKSIKNAWLLWKKPLEDLSDLYQKPILFTEFGYKSTEYTTAKPWEHQSNKKYCEICQANALAALFQEIWNKPWFSGGFVWKWFEKGKSINETNKNSFVFQKKMAEKVISEQFRQQ